MSLSHDLAPAGSTGSTTHPAVFVGASPEAVGIHFVVTAIGATPTVTWKTQGSIDGTNWFDVGYITDASDSISQATRVATTVSASVAFLSNPVARRYNYFRLVTSANTNVTYSATLHAL